MKQPLLSLLLIISLSISNAFSQKEIDFSNIDKHTRNTPEEVEKDLELLADYLLKAATTDMEKVRSIYVWITQNISYDNQAYTSIVRRINRNNQDILNRKKAVCFGYATLFKALCEEVGVQAELISGYSWNTLTSSVNPGEPDHAWNAVKIDGNWYLLDATWGSSTLDQNNTFLRSENQDYFVVDPKVFIKAHLPQDPMWQLLACPIDLKVFFSERLKIEERLASKDTCFNFKDSIATFESMNPATQKIKTAENALRFNPTQEMKDELASTYLDQAGILSNQIDEMDPEKESEEIKKAQEEIIRLCRKAVPLSKLYAWQWELFIGTLINHAVINYNTSTTENYKQTLKYAIELLNEAQQLLVHSQNTFFKVQAQEQCSAYLNTMREELKRYGN